MIKVPQAYWNEVSKVALSEKEIQLFREQLNWAMVSRFANLTNELWIQNEEILNYTLLSLNQNVPAEVYNTLKEKVDWEELATQRKIDEELVKNLCLWFPTLLCLNKNKFAKTISEKTWDEIAKRNGVELEELLPNRRKRFIKKHIIDTGSLATYASQWDDESWKNISEKQPIDFQFAKRFPLHLHTSLLRNKNSVARLSNAEQEELMEIVCTSLDDALKGASCEANWVELCKKHTFTHWFQDKYEEEVADYFKKHKRKSI